MNFANTKHVGKSSKLKKINRVSFTEFQHIVEDKNNKVIDTQTSFSQSILTTEDENSKKKKFHNIFSVGKYFNLFEGTDRIKLLQSILTKIRKIDFVIAILSLIVLVIAIFDFEIIFLQDNVKNHTEKSVINLQDDTYVEIVIKSYVMRYIMFSVIIVLIIINLISIYYLNEFQVETGFVIKGKKRNI